MLKPIERPGGILADQHGAAVGEALRLACSALLQRTATNDGVQRQTRYRAPHLSRDPPADLCTKLAQLGNDEIAQKLYMSPATVRTHVSRAMTKLGVRDRAQLVVLAYETGLVRPNWLT
jgi:FixJ family two-component response regulator